MPKFIDTSVKKQIIELYLQGNGRNDISKIMKGTASSGTISNVLKQYRESRYAETGRSIIIQQQSQHPLTIEANLNDTVNAVNHINHIVDNSSQLSESNSTLISNGDIKNSGSPSSTCQQQRHNAK